MKVRSVGWRTDGSSSSASGGTFSSAEEYIALLPNSKNNTHARPRARPAQGYGDWPGAGRGRGSRGTTPTPPLHLRAACTLSAHPAPSAWGAVHGGRPTTHGTRGDGSPIWAYVPATISGR